MDASAQLRAGRELRAPQKFVRAHRLAPRALQLQEPHRALATGHGEPIIENRSRNAAPLPPSRAQNLDAHWPVALDGLAPGAGKRRETADVVVHLLPGLAPVDARFVFVDLRGVSHALLRLRREHERAAFEIAERARHEPGA